MKPEPAVTALVVEDGDEYLQSLAGLDGQIRWLQAKSAAGAWRALAQHSVGVLVLDMRFDRSPRDELVGDHAVAAREHGGDAERGWRYLAQHQGLYILAELRGRGCRLPALLAYDFSREARRFAALQGLHGPIDWVGDDADANHWRQKLRALATGS